jgi:hypothetical protein
MGLKLLTTTELFDRNLANIEGKINQTSPLNDKAFNRVLSAILALNDKELQNFAADRATANLVITATAGDLDILGAEYGVTRKPAEAAVLTIELPATTGTIIPVTVDYTGDSNGVRYLPDASATAAAGIATQSVTAQALGTAGNLNVSDTMSIGTQIAGAETQATVTVIDNTGADEETDAAYRQRILDKIQSVQGGGNSADYRIWSEEVAGVARAYPYAGNALGTGSPPERIIYVEAETSIDPDGLAPGSLLTEVRDSITADPVTGISRQPLGLTDDTLFIVSITRTSFFVEIRGLSVDATIEAQVKADVATAIETYFRSLRPFIDGLDVPSQRNDTITALTVGNIVQDVLGANGASAETVSFGLTASTTLPEYNLSQGETGKNGGITYA